ncbi:hypothetical protein BD779DRAFT_1699861 [Infundibulicybe gibba]|nr:hypothetical protein BD779DRAFT_1699861 [Infundibulicybe gibba]
MLKRLGSPVLLHTIFSLFQTIRGVPSNQTIDDTKGDSVTGALPVYLPAGPWDDASCGGCAIHPDPDKAFRGTWTAATFHPELMNISINFGFQGTAVYVFFINANNQGNKITTLTECDFYVDGAHSSSYQHAPTASTELDYNVLAFSAMNLVNSDHTISIVTANKNHSTFLNFDYALYTIDDGATISSAPHVYPPLGSSTLPTFSPSLLPDSPPVPGPLQSAGFLPENTSKEGPSIGVIVGETIGGMVGFGMLIALLLLWYFRFRDNPVKTSPLKLRHGAMLLHLGTKPPFYGSEQAVGLRGFILQKYEEALPRYSATSFSPPSREGNASNVTPANYHAEPSLPILEPNRRCYSGHERDDSLAPPRPLDYEMMRRMQELSAPTLDP